MKKDYWLFIDSMEREYFVRRKSVAGRFQLSSAEVDVLLFLANNPHLDTAADIVKMKKMQKSHVSLAVNELADKGLLLCEPDAGNRKRIHLKLTETSSNIVRAGQKMQMEFIEFIFAGFSDEERKLIQSFCDRIECNLYSQERGHKNERR